MINFLDILSHRPWPIPDEKWKYYQEWNNAVFLHWQVNLGDLKSLVPSDLEIDLFEGKAWVSLVIFKMEKIRPRNLPPFAPISNFDEINIRTYVKKNNKTGVYFLSIEAGSKLSCIIAKTLSELPYRYSKMNRKSTVFQSENKQFGDSISLNYSVGRKLTEKTNLNTWLTERYSLFQDTSTSINEFEIHHVEWPIYQVSIENIDVHYPRFSQLINNSPEKIQYSTGVQVIAWGKKVWGKQN